MGCERVNNTYRLEHKETVRLDHDQLELLVMQLGPVGADQLVSHAMEELAIAIARVERHHRDGALDHVASSVHAMVAIANQVGMTTLARVGRDVLSLIGSSDGTAYCAALARLIRIGEQSLVAVWDLQDMRI